MNARKPIQRAIAFAILLGAVAALRNKLKSATEVHMLQFKRFLSQAMLGLFAALLVNASSQSPSRPCRSSVWRAPLATMLDLNRAVPAMRPFTSAGRRRAWPMW